MHHFASGFLSPLHNCCLDSERKELPPHYRAVLIFSRPITNRQCKGFLNQLRYQYSHVRKADDLAIATRNICHVAEGGSDYYDKNDLQWFGLKRDEPDYRLWFPYKIYTKASLKRKRGWTDKCLRFLPKSTDLFQNPYYQSKIYPAWNQYIIADLEKREPIKSILDKKGSKIGQHKRKIANQKRKVSIARHKRQSADNYNQRILQKASDLSPELTLLALVLSKLTILNHLAKYLSNWQHEGNKSQRYQQLTKRYSPDTIYALKGRILRVLFHQFPKQLRLSFYQPDDPDKVSVNLCPDHLEQARYSFGSISEYICENMAEIYHCPNCQVTRIPNYYSCYNFAIELNNQLSFDYHLPYTLGKDYFPKIDQLPGIQQMPNEVGPFQFGHEAGSCELDYALQFDLLDDLNRWAKTYEK